MKSINIFSQRYKAALLSKKITVSIYSGIVQTIYNLFEKYNSQNFFSDYINDVMSELRIYQPSNKEINGVSILEVSLRDFMYYGYPSNSLDAIEVFSTLIENNEFVKDINNLFYNNELPYELINNEVNIIPQFQVPQSLSNDMKKLKEDIDGHIIKKEYSLIVDRLHTYYGYLLQEFSNKLNLSVKLDANNHIILSASNKAIAEFLFSKNVITEFEKKELVMANSLLDSFNSVRNTQTGAHPNPIISNDDAEFVVKIISANMLLLEKKVKNYLQQVN